MLLEAAGTGCGAPGAELGRGVADLQGLGKYDFRLTFGDCLGKRDFR